MVPKSLLQDDFVRTISDDDEDLPGYEDSGDSELDTPQPSQSNSTKRKRGTQNEIDVKENKKQKLHKSRADTGREHRKDGLLNPEFEFVVGNIDNSVEAGFGSWDLPLNSETKTLRTAAGIEDIIARRKKSQETTRPHQADSHGDEASANGNGVHVDDEDELFAEDGFGMGASREEDEESYNSQDEVSDANSQSPEAAEDAVSEQHEEESEDDVAAPMPHPDDITPEASDDEVEDPKMVERRAAFFAPEEPSMPSVSRSFQSMSLSRPLLRGLSAVGFSEPTPIQVKTIPVALLGKDVVGGAVTGSGKTAAFIVPILERLLYRPRQVATTRVAILMPTRELAVQCYNVATKLAAYTDISFALIVGGLSLREQEQTLKKRPDVVIATPGRFIDHMRNSASFAIEHLEILVLDEADRMLEDGFADELNEILATIPKSRQTMLFSATMTEDVDKLIRAGLNRPVRLMVDAKKQTVQNLVQEFIKLKGGNGDDDEERRLACLLQLCGETYTSKTIIFFPRKSLAHRVKVLFSLNDIKAAELHGSMSQEQRLAAISSFRDGQCTHLLATDLASRGLDIPRVETVMNFTVPTTTTSYLHRVGRTARAGRSGVACTLFSAAKANGSKSNSKCTGSAANERTLLRPILRLARSQNADIRTRTLPQSELNDLVKQVVSAQEEIDSILAEEKEERLLQRTERDLVKGENLVKFEEEIASRPKRTWFQGEKDKQASSKLGLDERLGVTTGHTEPKSKKEKRKLSGKDKKRLQDRDDRRESGGHTWKKGKEERAGKGVLARNEARKKAAKRKNVPAKQAKMTGRKTASR